MREVEVLYDDGVFQEFRIFVDWEGEISPVRTVRFREESGSIAFFSPVPPPPMTCHQGFWRFIPLPEGGTQLIAERTFLYPNDDLLSFSGRFRDRLERLLNKVDEKCQQLMLSS